MQAATAYPIPSGHITTTRTPMISTDSIARALIEAISAVDTATLRELATADVIVSVPGARFVDLTVEATGTEELCKWAEVVRRKCGRTTFDIHHILCDEQVCMVSACVTIERLPNRFHSPCAFALGLRDGHISAVQLLVDSYALEQFRGLGD